MVLKCIVAALILASGFLAALLAIQISFGIMGGDIWHADFLSSYWWIALIGIFILDIFVIVMLQKFELTTFSTLDYALFLCVPYILGLVIVMFWIQSQ